MCDTKACTKCGVVKPLTEFYRDRTKGDGYRGQCKACDRPAAKKYYDTNADELNRKCRESYYENHADRTAQQKEYRQTARGRAAHIAKANARRAAKLQRTPAWADMEAIKSLYEESARLQDLTGIEFHIDHVIPLQGELVSGLHVETNLQVIPAALNVRKSNKFKV